MLYKDWQQKVVPEDIRVMAYFYKLGDIDLDAFTFLLGQFKSSIYFKCRKKVEIREIKEKISKQIDTSIKQQYLGETQQINQTQEMNDTTQFNILQIDEANNTKQK